MIRIYIMLLIGGGSIQNPRRPKYADLGGVTAFGSIRYGEEGICLTAMELTQQDHNMINADPEVLVLPANIDDIMSQNAVDKAKQFLEDNYIPGNWVSISNTFREVLRMTAGCFLYTQRYAYISGREKIFLTGVNLDTQIKDVPTAKRNDMQQAADELGYDYLAVTGTWTLRQYLKHLAEQWSSNPINLNVVNI